MELIDKISESIIHAMKNKDNDQLESLRAIKSALLLAKTQKNSNGEILLHNYFNNSEKNEEL